MDYYSVLVCLIDTVFGICTVKAQNMSTSPHASDRLSARHLAKASFWVSITGIILGTVTIIVSISLAVVAAASAAKKVCEFSVHGRCYINKELMSADQCFLKGFYYDHHCYYN